MREHHSVEYTATGQLSASDYMRSGTRAIAAGGFFAQHPPIAAKLGMPVYSQSPSPSYDVFKFRRFRFNLVRFLRLPMDISEADLRDAILECSVNVFANYVIRAKRAAAQSGGIVEVVVRQAPSTVPRAIAV
jgi:hypothetical protein